MSGATPTVFCSSKLNARTVRVRDDEPKDGVREMEGQTDRGSVRKGVRDRRTWERVRDGRKKFSPFNINIRNR
jgi:hypothetical protein